MKFNNNNNSKFIILNIKVTQIDYKFNYIDLNNLIIDWVDESLIKKYNKYLNWNIGILYPIDFYLTTKDLKDNYNKKFLLDTQVIKILIYLDNKLYPSFNSNKLLYTNEYDINDNNFLLENTNIYGESIQNSSINISDLIININKLENSFNLNSGILTSNYPKFIESISLSGVDKFTMLNELDIIKLGNKFTKTNYINDFIYLKNIQTLGKYNLINCNDAYNNFTDNLMYYT